MIIPSEAASADRNAGRAYPAPSPALQSSVPKPVKNKNKFQKIRLP
jgi:hypothetical protein